jgi:hypothetical protein
MNSPKRLARTAGLYYLIVAILGGFAHIVRVNVYAPGDAATTAENVVANASLVRLSFVAVFLVMALHQLLQHVNKAVARAMVIFVVLQVGITCLNMVHQLGALVVATEDSYASALGTDGSNALVLLLLDLQHSGYLVAQIFFGLWLFPLGLLAYRSGMFPRPLGAILMVACAAYLVDVPLQFLASGIADAINPVVVALVILSEVSMVGYLLIKGVKTVETSTSEDRDLVAG